MKEQFFEYFPSDSTRVSNAFKSGIISFDANVLLNLYLYTEATRNQFLTIFNSMAEGLSLTNQSCREYLENRFLVRQGQIDAYEKLK